MIGPACAHKFITFCGKVEPGPIESLRGTKIRS